MKQFKLISITLLSLSVTACGDKVSGEYGGDSCRYFMDFKGDGIVHISGARGVEGYKVPYKIEDDTITLTFGPFPMEFKIYGDTLVGPEFVGKCVKQ